MVARQMAEAGHTATVYDTRPHVAGNCFTARDETDVRATLRDQTITEDERRERIARLFASSVLAKLPGHGINDPSFIQPDRPMSAIGG